MGQPPPASIRCRIAHRAGPPVLPRCWCARSSSLGLQQMAMIHQARSYSSENTREVPTQPCPAPTRNVNQCAVPKDARRQCCRIRIRLSCSLITRIASRTPMSGLAMNPRGEKVHLHKSSCKPLMHGARVTSPVPKPSLWHPKRPLTLRFEKQLPQASSLRSDNTTCRHIQASSS